MHEKSHVEFLIGRLTDCLVQIDDDQGLFTLDRTGRPDYDTRSWKVWDWIQGVGLYGLVNIYERTGNLKYLKHVTDWVGQRLAEPEPVRNINTMAPLYTMAYLAERNEDAQLRTLVTDWAHWVMTELPRTEEGGFQHVAADKPNEGQLWDDTLMMTVIPLAKIGLLIGRQDYVEEAIRQFLLHAKYLPHRPSGLWYHGWSFETKSHLSGALWGRGNSWVTMAIPDFMELVGVAPSSGVGMVLVETLARQAAALAEVQRADGLWPTLLDEPDSYGEASATAGFAYGILKSIRLGLLDKRFLQVGQRAIDAIIANIDPETGALGNVSYGTPIFPTLREYRELMRTPMPYGQAMAMLALDESLRVEGV